MPQINDQPIETSTEDDVHVRAVTNFQVLPDNGGFNLVLGTRRLVSNGGPYGTIPEFKVEVFAAAYLSHFMMKDLARVLSSAIRDFEAQVGAIAFPDVDAPPRAEGGAEQPQ